MHIVINTIPLLSKLTGIGNCIYNISEHLLDIDNKNKYTFYYGYFSKKLQPVEYGKTTDFKFTVLQKTIPLIKKIPFLRDLARQANRKYVEAVHYARRFDVYYEPNFIPINIKAKRIVTTIHDFSFHLHPEWHPEDRIVYFQKNFYRRIYESDLVITVSNFTKTEAKNFLKIDENKIRVVYMGHDNTIFKLYDKTEVLSFRNSKRLPENFILFVGSIEPRKNIERLLLAYMQLPEYIKREFKLVLVGFSGWKNKNIMRLIDKMRDNVKFLGYLNTQELSLAYNRAKIFAYPSLYEGFGLPPLEAMACGCPVVVSNAASLPEVCGDAAYYVNPYDVESIAEGIYKVATDEELGKNLIQKGLQRAKIFSWEKSAREHIKVFEEVLNS